MKSVCLLSYTNPLCGGTDKMCVYLANALSNKYSVYILGIYGTNHSFFEISNKVNLNILCPLASKINFLRFFTRKLDYKINKLRKFVIRKRIDIIIDVDTGLTEISSPACKGLNIYHISWDHYSDEFLKSNGLRQRAFDINSYNQNDIVVLTKAYYQYYLNSKKFNKNKLHQIYNPVTLDFDGLNAGLKSNKVLTIGRYHEEKCYDKLLDAWSLIEDQISGWELHIYGRDQDGGLGYLKAYKDNLDLRSAFLHNETNNVKDKYLDSDIFVLSSEHEGQPLVLLEACAAGLPIVSFNCSSGVSEVVQDGVNGFLIDPGDYKMLAKKVLLLMHDNELKKNFGYNSLKIASGFSKENFIESWMNLLET